VKTCPKVHELHNNLPDSALANHFVIGQSFRVPGLGLLVLSESQLPYWLVGPPLHTVLMLQLHRPTQLPLALTATIEELVSYDQEPVRALLLDADPEGGLPLGAWLTLDVTAKGVA
jgi:hypothetical protein